MLWKSFKCRNCVLYCILSKSFNNVKVFRVENIKCTWWCQNTLTHVWPACLMSVFKLYRVNNNARAYWWFQSTNSLTHLYFKRGYVNLFLECFVVIACCLWTNIDRLYYKYLTNRAGFNRFFIRFFYLRHVWSWFNWRSISSNIF